MNAAETFQAAIPEPVQILGLRLKPFCLGHYFLLTRFDVAFVADESREATLQDLILGVLICSMTYEGFLAFLELPDYREQVQQWGAKMGIDFELGEKVRIFNEYLAEASRQPVIVYECDTTTSGAHWALVVKATLTSACGYTVGEAMNLPLRQAFLDFYRDAERNGVISIADEELARQLSDDGDGEVATDHIRGPHGY
jgi:hypothetical protein